MGTDARQNLAHLIDDLTQDGPNFNVFQAVRLSEMLSKSMHPLRKDFLFAQDGLHFRPHEFYGYPPKDIRDIAFDKKENTFNFVLNFMGLYGINAPLPFCYHEEVALQQNVRGPGNVALQEFLDIFNNRLYWFYYQAWKKYRYQFNLHEDSESGVRDRVFAFIGRGPLAERKDEAVPAIKLLQFSGILSLRVRSKAGLLVLLRNMFPRFDVEVNEFVPQRIKISERPVMGGKNGGATHRLGDTSFLGSTMVDYSSRIQIVIGPISFEEYLQFTPEGENARILRELLALYLNDGLTYNVKFLIKSETIAKISWNDRRLKLGSTVWLGRPKMKFAGVEYRFEKYTGAN